VGVGAGAGVSVGVGVADWVLVDWVGDSVKK